MRTNTIRMTRYAHIGAACLGGVQTRGALRRLLLLLASGVFIAGCSGQYGGPAANGDLATVEQSQPDIQNTIEGQAANKTVVRFDQATNMALALSPGNDRFVLSIQGTLFELPANGGRAIALTDYYQDAREPQFSPDGSQVVYHGYGSGSWDIYTLTLATGQITRLTDSPFDDREPVFASDGRSVVFSSDRSGNYDLWQLELTSSELTQLTDAPQDDYSPSFFKNGNEIAFVRHLQRDESELRVLSVIDGKEHAIAREAGIISGVSVSPFDGSIAYQLLRRDRVGQAHTDLKLAPTTGGVRTLSAKGADVFPFRAAWARTSTTDNAPDTQWTLVAAQDGQLQQFVLEATKQKKLPAPTSIPFQAELTLNRPAYKRKQRDYSGASKQALGIVAPALSYTADRVAFTALGDLWQWDFESDELQQLTDDGFADATPSYSPDGNYIAYVSDREGAMQLWLHSLAEGTHRRLDSQITGVSYPAWSPDGKQLAYFGQLPGNPLGGQLMIADLASGSSQTVGAPTSPQPLSWSGDSRYLAAAVLAPYSRRYREGVYDLLIFNRAGKEAARVELLEHLSPFDVRLTPDGKAVGYVQGGQLYYQPIDSNFNKTGPARRIGTELADMPAWSGDGKEVLVLSGNKLRRYEVASGQELQAKTVPLDYSRKLATKRWTLRTARLFDGVNADYHADVDIIINGNRIEALVPSSELSPQPVIDVGDNAVIPGLFEMHAHMGNPSEPQGRTWLAYGITSVRDPGSNPYLAKERQEVWDSGRRPGPRTHITGYLTDGRRVFYPIAESLNEKSLHRSLERTKLLKLDFIKTYVRLPDQQQQRVTEFAHALGIPTSSHELFPAAAYGMDHVEHIGGTSRRGYQPKVTSLGHSYADVVELLVTSNMGITPTTVLPAWAVIFKEDKDLFETPAFRRFYGPEVLKTYSAMAQRFGAGAKAYHRANSKLLRQLVQRDGLLVTGTDSPFVPYGTGLHAELRLFERAGLEPWQVLRAASAKAAQAAGVDNELGTVAKGMLADLVVIDGDPLKTIKDADNVVLTVKGGQRFRIEELLRE